MKLIIVRHAQTVKNAENRTLSSEGGNLTELGKEQAKQAAQKLKNENFDVIYSSDLERCVDTTKYITKYHKTTPTYYIAELREINVGILDRLPIRIPNFVVRAGTPIVKYLNLKLPGAESVGDVKLRVTSFLNDIYDKYPNGNVLIVSHGVTMRVFEAVFSEAKNVSSKPIDNCAIWHKEMTKRF